MLRVLIVCNSGVGTSVVLKDRLSKTIPENEYIAAAMKDVLKLYKDYDVILTFKELAPHVQKILRDVDGYNLKTIEGFNDFAKELFNEYLLKD